MEKKVCPTCGREFDGLSKYCTECGIELISEPNRCSGMKTELCKEKNYSPDDKYCQYCGSPTTYWKDMLEEIKNW